MLTALRAIDHNFMVTQPKTEAAKQRNRQIALKNVKRDENQGTSSLSAIRTKYNFLTLPLPKPISQKARQNIKENAKPFDDLRQPYPITLRANITEHSLPMIKANIRLSGIDSEPEGPVAEFLSADMLWDTGAHISIISIEMLSDKFRESLKTTVHDPYRSPDGVLRLQMDATIGFSNTPLSISAIVAVVLQSLLPNERVGFIFGQQQCIEKLSYYSVPRCILAAKGEATGEEIWGDFVLQHYIDEKGELNSF